MLKKILTYGLIAGAVAAAPMFLMMPWMHQIPLTAGMAIGYLSMLIAFTTVFVAIKRWRDVERGGVIRFLPALGLGLGIVAIGSLIYALAWEVQMALNPSDFIGGYAKALIAEKQAAGASAAEIAKLTGELDAMRAQYNNPLYRIPMTLMEILPVGLLVAFVSAGLLRFSAFLPARPIAAPAP